MLEKENKKQYRLVDKYKDRPLDVMFVEGKPYNHILYGRVELVEIKKR